MIDKDSADPSLVSRIQAFKDEPMTNEDSLSRVAPLEAGVGGQDLPQSDSGAKSPLQSGRTLTVLVCGGGCLYGGEHDMSGFVTWPDGGSVSCVKCGRTAMDLDLMRLP